MPWPVTITQLHHSSIKEYSSSSFFSTPQEHLTASRPSTPPVNTNNITYSNENDHEIFRHMTGTDGSLIVATAVSIPILVIVMAVISALVVAALLCMKAKRLTAGGAGRVVPHENSVYFGENACNQHVTTQRINMYKHKLRTVHAQVVTLKSLHVILTTAYRTI